MPSKGEPSPTNQHDPDLFQRKRDLSPDPPAAAFSTADPVVEIRMFGPLWLRIGDQVIYDHHWRSHQAKMLLAALVVLGGTKVPADALQDMFWPDTEGDMAFRNLKMALSRLRRVGCSTGRSLPWIVIRHKQVSLLMDSCSVDALSFSTTLSPVMQAKDVKHLQLCLDLYQDDFLPHESLPWIVRHRGVLRRKYVHGVLALTELCLKQNLCETALPYLHRCLEIDRANEELFAGLMRAYICLGYPSRAVHIFQWAKDVLDRELSTEPGPILNSLRRRAMQGG